MHAHVTSPSGDAPATTMEGEGPGGLAPRLEQWSQHLQRADDPLQSAVVVIVDDNDTNVVLLERILRGAGVSHVHGIVDPRHAVQRCLELDADLLLLDLHMPHVDGFAVLAALTSALPTDTFLPVIVLTADTTTPTRERALEAGAHDFLTKPFDRTEVIQRARNLLRTRALHQGTQREHQRLQAELAQQVDAQDQRERERQQRRDRITAVLDGDGLRMVFQPILELATARTVGVEALARFDVEPHRTPDVWFAEANDIGLGPALEVTAIDAALGHLAHLPPDVLLSVNASPATVAQPRLLELARSAGPRMVLELTEHERILDYPALLGALDVLRHHGVRIAADDAGAGYAGLRHILHLRPDIIKLDLELTRDIDTDPARRALAASLVTFAHDTGAVIIAEGIETPAELHTLRQLGVPWGQGYHLARPGPLTFNAPRVAGTRLPTGGDRPRQRAGSVCCDGAGYRDLGRFTKRRSVGE